MLWTAATREIMPRFNRAVGGLRPLAKRKGKNTPTRRAAAAPAQVAALKSFGFPVPHYLKAYEMPDQPTDHRIHRRRQQRSQQ